MEALAAELEKQKTERRRREAANQERKTRPLSERERAAEEFAREKDALLARFEIIREARAKANANPDEAMRDRELAVIEKLEREWGLLD